MSGVSRARSLWGWGWADRFPDDDARRGLAARAGAILGIAPPALRAPPTLETIRIPEPALAPPPALAPFCSAARLDRAMHTHGKSYRDLVRAFTGDFAGAPDFVAYPRDEADVGAVLAFCVAEHVAVVPFGGGTSVVGGIERPRAFRAAVSLESARDGPRRRDRRHLARRAHPGRGDGAAPRGAARRKGPHPAALPPELRALDARRLDCHTRGRALRHALHAHRRPARVGPHGHAEGCLRDTASARIGRRAGPGPPRARLGGNPGGHRGGVDAGAPTPTLPGVGQRAICGLRGGRTRGSRGGPGGAVPVQLPPARSARGHAERRACRWRRCAAAGVRVGGPFDDAVDRIARSPSRPPRGGRAQARRRRRTSAAATRAPRRGVRPSSTRRISRAPW